MSKLLKFDTAAREALFKGATILTDAVASTLGPKGRNVTIERRWSSPLVVHDGVTVAKEIDLKDPFENLGAQLVKAAASKTNDNAGDGTTTSTILAQAMMAKGLAYLDKEANPMTLRSQMNVAAAKVVDFLREKAIKLTTPQEVIQIAKISAQDEVLGELIGIAAAKIGLDGIITVEEGSGRETTVDYKEGMEIGKGYMSPYFVTDDKRMEARVDDPFVLITNHVITRQGELTSLLESLLPKSRNLVIICDELSPEVQAYLVANRLRGVLNVLAVSSPGFGDTRVDLLEDLAALTGATFIDRAIKKFSTVIVEDLGRATQVTSTSESTIIVGGTGNIDKRVDYLKEKLKKASNEFDKEKFQTRLAKLVGGAAVISVGGSTEAELKENKERVIDAVAATRAAMEEGIIPGGASMLMKAAGLLTEIEGEDIVRTALQKPFIKLMQNAGLDYLDLLATMSSAEEGEGIDVMDGQLKNLIEAGIIDPVKVVRSAIQNAVSVAGSALTTDTLIVNEPEEEKKKNETT